MWLVEKVTRWYYFSCTHFRLSNVFLCGCGHLALFSCNYIGIFFLETHMVKYSVLCSTNTSKWVSCQTPTLARRLSDTLNPCRLLRKSRVNFKWNLKITYWTPWNRMSLKEYERWTDLTRVNRMLVEHKHLIT